MNECQCVQPAAAKFKASTASFVQANGPECKEIVQNHEEEDKEIETHFGRRAYSTGSGELVEGNGEIIAGVRHSLRGCTDLLTCIKCREERVGVH